MSSQPSQTPTPNPTELQTIAPTAPQGQVENWTDITVNTIILTQQTTWDGGRTTWDGGRTTWDAVTRGFNPNVWNIKSEG